jgi:hypothetical protein
MNLPNELIRHIIYFLHNDDIFNMYKTCNIHKQILNDKIVIEYLNHRNHPIVFNLLDNFCLLCNLRIIFLCDTDSIYRCNHT